MEYFKNVMLRLYETGEAEALLPVVAQVGGKAGGMMSRGLGGPEAAGADGRGCHSPSGQAAVRFKHVAGARGC